MIEQLTQHFGIAPLLQKLPTGLETLTVPAASALTMTFPEKPYWAFANGKVTFITDERTDEVAKALRETTPGGRK